MNKVCPKCEGSGRSASIQKIACPECAGNGDIDGNTCSHCSGCKQIQAKLYSDNPCPNCKGKGRVSNWLLLGCSGLSIAIIVPLVLIIVGLIALLLGIFGFIMEILEAISDAYLNR